MVVTRDTNAPLDTGRGAGVHYPRTSILKVHETPTGCKAQDAVPVIVALGDLGVSETYTERLPRLASAVCCEKGRGPNQDEGWFSIEPESATDTPSGYVRSGGYGGIMGGHWPV